ncbi:hypothetical protein ABMA28_009971 [Loxostege sticticalis]|uniref:ENTH domain-containing protein n=2 Tax=Loxostege sticticalis TaxID=481309 RepID=A0ABD0SC20_LOXSC
MDRFISMWKVRELADKVTNVVMNYTEIEGKVREATSDEAWGPTGQQMQELALATFTYEHFPEVMSMLWRRMLHDNRAHWRRTYKCLLLLSYLVRNGSERVVTSAREHIYDLRSLENYTYVDDIGKDQGINVRHKVRELIDFIQDDEKLREERKKAKKNKDKYIGMSSEAAVMGTRSSSGGWGEYSDRSGTTWDEPKERREDEDDYEREDSDGDYGHRKPNKENVYRDAEVISSSPPRRARSPETAASIKSLSISLKSPAKGKPNTPIKKIDLGAAASYGKSAPTPAPTPATTHSNELIDDLFKTCAPTPQSVPAPSSGHASLVLEDDFDPRAGEPKATKESNDFGEFANAFGAPADTNNDGFADFSSAFTSQQPASLVTLPTSAPVSLTPQQNAAPASNLDLLSELSPPPLAPMQGFNALDSLTGQLAATTLQPTVTPGSDAKRPTIQESAHRAIRQLIDTLQAIERIKLESEAMKIRECVRTLKGYLPGPITVQKLCRLDDNIITGDVLDSYSQALGLIIKVILPHWPLLKEDILPLFVIEESFFLSHEILSVLCGFLKNETDNVVLKSLAYILLKYVMGDAVLTAILDCSCTETTDKNEMYRYRMEWENYVQLLATLPERVANRLQTETPKEFSHENFSYKLIFHVVRSVDYMSESCFHQQIVYAISYLAHFLSKIIINYNMTDAILKFVDILVGWSANDQSLSKFVRRRLTQTLFHHLNRQAIDCIALILLKKCPIDYRSEEQAIQNILGENIDSNKDWNDILTYRLPFYYKPTDYRDTTIPENLIYYLSTTKKDVAESLSSFILKLASVWADVKFSNVSNIAQHMYISQQLLLAVKYRSIITNRDKKEWDLVELKSILYKGVSKHLRILASDFRCIGMATIEIIFKTLASDDTEKEAAAQLNFDFTTMEESCKEIQNILRNIVTKCLIDPERKIPRSHKVKPIDLKGLLDLVAAKVADDEYKPAQNTMVTCAVKTPEQTKEIVKSIISVKLDALERSGKDETEQLDSDDDLQPYDMSNDVSVTARKRPNYLRDLLEVVVEAKDVETFEASLEAAEELVNKQLKTEDKKLAEDLLNLFVHLEEKYHVDNFDSIKFNTVVAIVCSQPKVCAEYLCKEIHTDVGRYSIATKIFMLDALSEAANRIADIKHHTEEKIKTEIVAKEDENVPAEEIIRRRLINKTRYFHSIRPHPFSKAKRNEFAAVSDYFFYPLVSGFGHTPDPKIQMAVISLLASVVLVLPASILKTEFLNVMMEFRSWLSDCLTNVDLTMRFGGAKTESAIFAGQVLYLMEKAIQKELKVSIYRYVTHTRPPTGVQPAPAAPATAPRARLPPTWAETSSINIDVDNLLAPRSPKAGPAPTINQLKSTPNSPAKIPNIGMAPSNMGMPPSNMAMPPSSMGNMGMAPSSMGMRPSSMSMPPSNMSIPQTNMGMPPSNMSIPQTNMGMPPSNMNMPTMGMPMNVGFPFPTDNLVGAGLNNNRPFANDSFLQ